MRTLFAEKCASSVQQHENASLGVTSAFKDHFLGMYILSWWSSFCSVWEHHFVVSNNINKHRRSWRQCFRDPANHQIVIQADFKKIVYKMYFIPPVIKGSALHPSNVIVWNSPLRNW